MKNQGESLRKRLGWAGAREFKKQRLLACWGFQMLLNGGLNDRKGAQVAYRAAKYRYMARLRKRYRPWIAQYLREHPEVPSLPRERSNRVWVLWLQGMESAPEIVRACYASLLRHLPKDRELILLTEENLGQYLEFPDYILEKYASGEIRPARFSDLIRVSLLTRYGGTWMDATIFLSDGDIPAVLFDSDLLFYQFSDPKNFYRLNAGFDDRVLAMSNWFITACKNNAVLLLVRELLLRFWREEKQEDYFVFHYMMQLALETYPEEWMAVPFCCSKNAFALVERMLEPYDARAWELIRRTSPVHKLSYKPLRGVTPDENSYAARIIRGEMD